MSLRRLSRLLVALMPCVLVAAACGLVRSDSSRSTVDQDTVADAGVAAGASSTAETASTATSLETEQTTTTVAPTTTTRPEPTAETDPAVLAEFISRHNGDYELDDAELSVRNLEAGEDKDDIPPEAFVDPGQWKLFKILGLVDPQADALAVGQHRINTIRGMCCPVTMWENDDHPLLRSSVLVHELTHLADDARDFNREMSDQDYFIAEREPVGLLFLPTEGNASRIQRLYEKELLAAGARPERFLSGWESPDIPDIMVKVWAFAYEEGQVFMQALVDRDGVELVETAFDRPPISSEQVYDIDAYLEEEYPLDVPLPELPSGAETLESSMTIGAFLLDVLAQGTLTPEDSRALVTSWSGDSAILYETGDRWCTKATIVMDDPAAASDLIAVLEAADIEAVPAQDAADTVQMSRCIEAPPEAGR